jgi:outer membrane immunogenic protein
MKSLFLGSIGLLACATAMPAVAADMPARPVYKAAPAMVSIYNWTGFYVGGNVGYSWGRANTEGSLDPDVGPLFLFSESLRPSGIIGGGQIGYNWHASHWVFGLEADLQASGQKDSSSRSTSIDTIFCLGPCFGSDVTNTATLEAKLKWFGTLRGRVGYAWDNFVLYGTGGLAYGRIEITGTSATEGTTCFIVCDPISTTSSFKQTKTKTGWTVGAGFEGAAPLSNWTWKIEYLYLDLGRFDATTTDSTSTPITVNSNTKITDHIARVGLNYRFGDVGKGPVVTRY